MYNVLFYYQLIIISEIGSKIIESIASENINFTYLSIFELGINISKKDSDIIIKMMSFTQTYIPSINYHQYSK